MESVSSIYLNGDTVGTARMENKGLYCHLSCDCRLPGDRIYRIYARTEETDINLGVCVPQGDRFILKTKLPIQRFAGATPQFYAAEKNENSRSFYKICAGEPFDHIESLRECCFVITENQPFLLTKGSIPRCPETEENRR